MAVVPVVMHSLRVLTGFMLYCIPRCLPIPGGSMGPGAGVMVDQEPTPAHTGLRCLLVHCTAYMNYMHYKLKIGVLDSAPPSISSSAGCAVWHSF